MNGASTFQSWLVTQKVPNVISEASSSAPIVPSRSIRMRLLMLVVACSLPLFIFGFGNAYFDYQTDKADAGRRAQEMTRTLSLLIQRDLEARLATLQVLALSPTLQNGDIMGFRGVAEAVLKQQLPGANILLLGKDGQQVMNTALPLDAMLPRRKDTSTLQTLFATAKPSVSDVFMGVVVHRPTIALEVPVMQPDGSVVYSLTLNPSPNAFDEIVHRQRLNTGAVVSILDRRGTIIARSPNGAEYVGTKAGAAVLPLLLTQSEGIVENISKEGIPVIVAFSHVPSIGWSVVIGLPRAEIVIVAKRAGVTTLITGVICLGIGLGLARVMARRIAEPIVSLRDLSAALEQDASDVRIATGLAETDEVARSLLAAACKRKRVEDRLRLMVSELNHRVKNSLSTVQSIALHTLRGTDQAVRLNLEARLIALGSAHGVLTRERWEGANIIEIAAGALAPFGGMDDQRFRISGLPLRLQPRAAVALAMGFHELATNAVKYGALSVGGGQVQIKWLILNEDKPYLHVVWSELGGPIVTSPVQRGFGTSLIERGLAQDLGGTAAIVFGSEGVRCEINAPLVKVCALENVSNFPQVGNLPRSEK